MAERHGQASTYWESWAARMVDRQAIGLANRIRILGQAFQAPQWQDQVLGQLAELFLLCEAFRHHTKIPPPLQQELWNQAGVGIRKKDLLAKPGYADHWQVMGRRIVLDTRLDTRRTWLYSPTHQRYALLLEYTVGDRSFEFTFQPGQAVETEMVYYPGAFPLRAWYKEPLHLSETTFDPVAPYTSHTQLLTAYAQALSQHPLLPQFPACLDQVIPHQIGTQCGLIDSRQQRLPLPPDYPKNWDLLATAGGQPIRVFGEWDGFSFFPLALADRDLWISL